MSAPSSTLVAVSLKAYLSAKQTRDWVCEVAVLVERRRLPDWLEVAVLPSFPLLESTAAALADTPVRWGAQDVAAAAAGAQTGEVTGELLAELGCRYVEVGHAERRRMFGEGPETLADKTRRVIEAGMVPIYCTGEQARGGIDESIRACVADVDVALTAAVDVAEDQELVIAYEPVWAIGADHPAPTEHIAAVCAALGEAARTRVPGTRVIYGGSAGPGTWTDLDGGTDGLFLGRFAHDPTALATVLDEVMGRSPAPATAAPTPKERP